MLQVGDVVIVNQRVINGWNGVLPGLDLTRNLWTQVKGAGAKIAVREFEPGAGKGIGKGVLVLMKPSSHRLHDRVVPERQVGGGHDRSG